MTEITVLLLMMSYEREEGRFSWLIHSSSPVTAERMDLTKYFSPDIAADIFEVSFSSKRNQPTKFSSLPRVLPSLRSPATC